MGCVSNIVVLTSVSLPTGSSQPLLEYLGGWGTSQHYSFYRSQFLLRSGGPRAITSVSKTTPSANS